MKKSKFPPISDFLTYVLNLKNISQQYRCKFWAKFKYFVKFPEIVLKNIFLFIGKIVRLRVGIIACQDCVILTSLCY